MFILTNIIFVTTLVHQAYRLTDVVCVLFNLYCLVLLHVISLLMTFKRACSNVSYTANIKYTFRGRDCIKVWRLVLTCQALALPTATIDHHPPLPLPPQAYNYATALKENESNYYCGMTVTLSNAVTGDGNKGTEHKQDLAQCSVPSV